MTPVRLSTRLADQQIDVIHAWLAGAYWSRGMSRDLVERALAGSLCVGAFANDGQQIGFARLVTDRTTFAYLCDVFVAESVRGLGVASQMLAHLDGLSELAGLRRWMLVTHDAHAVYRRHGWHDAAHPERLMERVVLNAYLKDGA